MNTGQKLKRSSCRRTMRGLTMIELIVTIAVAAILTTMAIPSFQYVTSANRLASESNALVGDMWYARNQAITEGEPVTVCTSSDGRRCSGSIDWHAGWIVFSDWNANDQVDTGEAIHTAQAAFAGTDSMVPAPTLSAVTFTREGFATGIGADVLFVLHDGGGNASLMRCVQLLRMGTAATETRGTGGCQ